MDEINKTQFVYKRELEVPGVKEDKENGILASDPYTKTVYDSFNIENVLRALTMDDGKILVLLDDLHERNQRVPKMTRLGKPVLNKQNVPQMETVRETFQSEIYLSEEEGKEFFKLTSINNYE